MTMTRTWMVAGALSLAVGGVSAEQMRTQLTKENRFPEYGRVEAGLDLRTEQLDTPDNVFPANDVDSVFAEPFARYQAFENVSLLARLPYVSVDSDLAGSESGLGDVELGAEWRAYENVFTFPYVIPHLTLALGTGDEDKGLGRGETGVTLGTTLGTKRWEDFTFNLDLAYTVFEDSDNVAALGLSLIWDISRKFSALVEGAITDEEDAVEGDNPYLLLGGMSYQPYDRFSWTVFGGAGDHGEPDVLVGLRATFDL